MRLRSFAAFGEETYDITDDLSAKIAQPRYQATLAAFYYNYLDLQVETL